MRIHIAAIIMICMSLTACSSVGDALSLKREPLTFNEQIALTKNMDYTTALVAISQNGIDKDAAPTPLPVSDDNGAAGELPPAPFGNPFGSRIGRYFLADDYVVYRHAKTASQPKPNVDQDTPLNASGDVQLVYFLVSPKGVIDDYAFGRINSAAAQCIRLSAQQFIICDDPDLLGQDFSLFDAAMRTSKAQPIEAWNISDNANILIDQSNAPMPKLKPVQ